MATVQGARKLEIGLSSYGIQYVKGVISTSAKYCASFLRDHVKAEELLLSLGYRVLEVTPIDERRDKGLDHLCQNANEALLTATSIAEQYPDQVDILEAIEKNYATAIQTRTDQGIVVWKNELKWLGRKFDDFKKVRKRLPTQAELERLMTDPQFKTRWQATTIPELKHIGVGNPYTVGHYRNENQWDNWVRAYENI